MKRHIVFFGAPYQGHVNPTLPVVADLVSRGCRITYATTEQFAKQVAATGAETIRYESVWPANRSVPAELSADELAKGPVQHLRENIAATEAVERELEGDLPDLVVYDSLMNFAGRALAEKWERPAAQSVPLLASNEHFSVLQALAGEFPAFDPQHPALVEFGTKLAEFRLGHGLSAPGPADFLAAAEDLNVVFVEKEFQPAAETFDDRYVFVGPGLPAPADRDPWSPPASGAPVLLIALGTLFNERPEFYRACVQAFAGQPWHVVLATGHVDPADLGDLPPNFEVHRSVPQLAVLERARVFVTHAGLRSTMEALHFGTPMVSVAQSVELDFTARRTAELGLGVRIGRGEVTPEALRDAVRTADEDLGIRERVSAVRDRVRAAGGATRAADAIEAYVRSI
ncbi:macrolide family glycosyltransferase [Streptomyces sp. NPDC101151]|uniref:macrolide family glycosyltransferase n=1 Tax=Streptomyces sp. NPDC101151 TaxID=3366115 RepID=UPI003816F72E